MKARIIKKEFVSKVYYIVQYKKFLFWHTISRDILELGCEEGPAISKVPKTFKTYEDAINELRRIVNTYNKNKLTSSTVVFSTDVKL
jgi:hypothetical protein